VTISYEDDIVAMGGVKSVEILIDTLDLWQAVVLACKPGRIEDDRTGIAKSSCTE